MTITVIDSIPLFLASVTTQRPIGLFFFSIHRVVERHKKEFLTDVYCNTGHQYSRERTNDFVCNRSYYLSMEETPPENTSFIFDLVVCGVFQTPDKITNKSCVLLFITFSYIRCCLFQRISFLPLYNNKIRK